jgi:acyl-[acyl-carrier-protein]-phospholipid O-acyltransferase/long-chain-fatty-acid--[acyl-carrier-protein] ligase
MRQAKTPARGLAAGWVLPSVTRDMTTLKLLRSRRFLPLFAVQFLGAFNDNVFKNAFLLLMTFKLAAKMGWSADNAVNAIGGLFIFPFLLFSAFAGQLADKLDKARLIRLTKLWEVIIMVAAGVGFAWEQPWALFAVIFAAGVQAAFFGPLKYGILPDHLRDDELMSGTGVIEMATFVAILLGTLLGGFLVAQAGGTTVVSAAVPWVLLGIAGAGWAVSFFVPPAPATAAAFKIDANIFRETWRLISYARTQRGVFRTILGISWFWAVGFVWLNLLPPYVKYVLHSDDPRLATVFLTLFAVGIGLGSMLCNVLLRGTITARYVPAAGLGLSLFTFDFLWVSRGVGATAFVLTSPVGLRICTDLAGLAVCGGLFSVPLYVIMTAWSEPSHRARNIAANNVVNALFMVGASIMAFALFKLGFNRLQVLGVMGGLNILVSAYIVTLVPESRLYRFFAGLRRKN